VNEEPCGSISTPDGMGRRGPGRTGISAAIITRRTGPGNQGIRATGAPHGAS
jgi:hypothetical protein